MSDRELKLTDLDYAIADHHLQMLKAALPYMEIPQQRTVSMLVKWQELVHTSEFFKKNDEGMMCVCSLDENHISAADMLTAVKPYANQREQELIDFISGLLSGRMPFGLDQLLGILPPEQQSRFETLQMVMQTLSQV